MKNPALKSDNYHVELHELIERILSHLPKDTPKLQRDFVRQYYAKMPVVELQQFEPALAGHIALNSFPFFATKSNRVEIRSFAPNQAAQPWNGNYFVIEVLNDDHAFILDSMRAELARQGYEFTAIIHPVIFLRRDKKGQLTELVEMGEKGDLPSGSKAESFVHFQLTGPATAFDGAKIEADLKRILGSVELVVDDFAPMQRKTDEAIREIGRLGKQFDSDELDEARDFLQWLANRHFVFLGYMEYDFYNAKGESCLNVVADSELGIFKIADAELKPQALATLPPEVLSFTAEPQLIEITKSSRRAIVHRPVLMDYIAIKRFDARGKVMGERRFLGLFTSAVYYQSAERIPFIRRKITRTLERANYDPVSHNGKSLKAILEFYPRDELFQISERDLFRFSIGLMALEAKPDVRLFVRTDRYERFVSCMVYIPKERFSSYLREQIVSILERAYKGKMRGFYTQLTESPLARVHLIIETQPGHIPQVEIDSIEQQIANITNQWADSLRHAVVAARGEADAAMLMPIYADAFPDSYLELQQPAQAVADIGKIEECIGNGGLAVDLYHRSKGESDHFHLKIYTYNSELALSDMLPILENLGCRVRDVNPFTISPKWQHGDILIRDFLLDLSSFNEKDLAQAKPLFEECLTQVWQHLVANDSFNALVLNAGLNFREVEIIRSYSHYLRQINFPYSNQYIAEALCRHPSVCVLLIQAFHARFDPTKNPSASLESYQAIIAQIDAYLNDVTNLAEDRIIRRLVDLLNATLRTNYFQTDAAGNTKPYLSFKFRSTEVPDLPKPVPYAEIFVYSLKMEGIHLRGDAVARGGLRWSDRLEDFRTEVLGLVKAQMVKNAVIVPHGAKGGFVLKQPPSESNREALQEEGVACYRQFLCGLLDITDNIIKGNVIPPKQVVRYDGDDPYLVVAADKGTASFSDIANGVAAQYQFWLGDAFASGGSAGYDHKAMAITARGAWVSVERHFREMGRDITREPFTVTGIGDMSGDVFGNGMLLSDNIRLVAAFNHRHIFLDPEPHPKKSFAERKRLFELPRSQWSDYQSSLISKGGGVFGRDLKIIELSKPVRDMLATKLTQCTPDQLIQLILKAPVDLLWNGGIGTYVKASDEAHSEVGDRANNAVRVNAIELRCKMIGEGGNLGLTQRARIEYARNGGRINTDAIDNSAGVDCSDHEVNIKIALSDAISTGNLSSEARDPLLEGMTDAVANLVLIDNRLQTQALTIAEREGIALLEPLSRMMQHMEQQDFLDRQVEYLPTDKQIAERRTRGESMTRPELAILLSYSKLAMYRDLKDSGIVKADYFIDDLLRYFPEAMQKTYRESILRHRLRPEIVATMITNSIVNRAGITFAHRIIEETGTQPCDLARAYVICRDAFKLRAIWQDIEQCSTLVDADTQADLFLAVQRFLDNTTRWFLEHCPEPINIESAMAAYAEKLTVFAQSFETLMSKTLLKAFQSQMEHFTTRLVPIELARRIAGLEVLTSACDIVQVSNQNNLDVLVVGRIYFELGADLRLGWLRRQAMRLSSDAYWEQLAVQSVIRELYHHQRRITSDAMRHLCNDKQCETTVRAWREANRKNLQRYQSFIQDLKAQDSISLSMLIVAVRHVESITAKEAI